MTQELVRNERVPNILPGRGVEVLARAILRSNNIEMFDDPRSEVEVAISLGLLVINDAAEV
jgi:hypothetical protein